MDQTHKGHGLGGALLADALHRSAAYAQMMDAKDEAALTFYRWHGFIALPNSPERAGQLLGLHWFTVYKLRRRFLQYPVTSAVAP